jgi:hypothetical protein
MSELPVIWCSVDEAIRISGISRSLLYDMMNDGRLKSAKVGKKRLVSVKSIEELSSDTPEPEPTCRRRSPLGSQSGGRISAVGRPPNIVLPPQGHARYSNRTLSEERS